MINDKYSELSVEDLMNRDYSRDPDVAYEIALRYKYGNGVIADEKKYQIFRKMALDNGYVEENVVEKPELLSSEESDIATINVNYKNESNYRLEELGKNGDPLACLELYSRSIEHSDENASKRYLAMIENLIKGIDDREKGGIICESIANIYDNNKEYETAKTYYEFAKEFGNINVLSRLIEYYVYGLVEKVPVDGIDDCMSVIFNAGTDSQKYSISLFLLNNNEIMRALAGFEKMIDQPIDTDAELLYIAKAGMQLLLHSKSNIDYTKIESIIDAAIEKKDIDIEFLELILNIWNTNNIELSGKMALTLANYYKDRDDFEKYIELLNIAVSKGSKEANLLLQDYENEKAAEREKAEKLREQKKIEFQNLMASAENYEVEAIEKVSPYLYEMDIEKGRNLWEQGASKDSILCKIYLARYYMLKNNFEFAYQWSLSVLDKDIDDNVMSEMKKINQDSKALIEREQKHQSYKENFVSNTLINKNKQIKISVVMVITAIIVRGVHDIFGKFRGPLFFIGAGGLAIIFISELLLAALSSRVIHRYSSLAKDPAAEDYAEEKIHKEALKPYTILQFIFPLVVTLTWIIMGEPDRILNGYIYLAILWCIGKLIPVGNGKDIISKCIAFVAGKDGYDENC